MPLSVMLRKTYLREIIFQLINDLFCNKRKIFENIENFTLELQNLF